MHLEFVGIFRSLRSCAPYNEMGVQHPEGEMNGQVAVWERIDASGTS